MDSQKRSYSPAEALMQIEEEYPAAREQDHLESDKPVTEAPEPAHVARYQQTSASPHHRADEAASARNVAHEH